MAPRHSRAILVAAAYFLPIFGVDVVDRASLAQFLAIVCLLMLGPVAYLSAHLVASSARRGGAGPQLEAVPMSPRARDLALCLAMLVGPAAAGLGLALLATWLAWGVVLIDLDGPMGSDWSVTDVAQVPAMVLGAGILGIVVARWFRYPGSLLLGFLGMCALALWMMAPTLPSDRPWFSWFAVGGWVADGDPWLTPASSMAWHAAYLVAWSWVGVCVVALRHPGGRRRRLLGLARGVLLLICTGIAQLPTS